MKLVKYRDAGMHTYTYFWVSDDQKLVSTYFDTEQDANKWYGQQLKKWKQDGIQRENVPNVPESS